MHDVFDLKDCTVVLLAAADAQELQLSACGPDLTARGLLGLPHSLPLLRLLQLQACPAASEDTLRQLLDQARAAGRRLRVEVAHRPNSSGSSGGGGGSPGGAGGGGSQGLGLYASLLAAEAIDPSGQEGEGGAVRLGPGWACMGSRRGSGGEEDEDEAWDDTPGACTVYVA